jgi:hypothetical protein
MMAAQFIRMTGEFVYHCNDSMVRAKAQIEGGRMKMWHGSQQQVQRFA